jgi:hopanoid C-3 methylase
MLWKFNTVYNAERQFADHHRPVRHHLPLPPQAPPTMRGQLYVLSRPTPPRGGPAGPDEGVYPPALE